MELSASFAGIESCSQQRIPKILLARKFDRLSRSSSHSKLLYFTYTKLPSSKWLLEWSRLRKTSMAPSESTVTRSPRTLPPPPHLFYNNTSPEKERHQTRRQAPQARSRRRALRDRRQRPLRLLHPKRKHRADPLPAERGALPPAARRAFQPCHYREPTRAARQAQASRYRPRTG